MPSRCPASWLPSFSGKITNSRNLLGLALPARRQCAIRPAEVRLQCMAQSDLFDCVRSCTAKALDDRTLQACLQPCQPDPIASTGPELSAPAAVALACGLIPFTALFAGLTLGLLRLDVVGLRILEQAGEPWERQCARAILPIRCQGNLLLCTLLLGKLLCHCPAPLHPG